MSIFYLIERDAMLSIFDKKNKNNQVNEHHKTNASKSIGAISSERTTVDLYSLDRSLLCRFYPNSTIRIKDNESINTIIMSVSTIKEEKDESTDFLFCEYISPENKKEISQMMEILSSDLQKARTKGVNAFVVPQTGLDLYTYIQARPSIDIDMDELAKELSNNSDKKLRTDLLSNIQSGKTVNIFIAKNCLYNHVACDMLKAAYSKYSNVHFYEIKPENNGEPINWNNDTIGSCIALYKNAINIGVGIEGAAPSFTLKLVQNEENSVISQAGALIMYPLNAREELLEAQAVGHAVAMLKVGQKRNLSTEVIEKAIRDLAKAAALYMYDESILNTFDNMAIKSKRIENGLCTVHLPFNDPILIKNYFTEAHTGLLAIVGEKELYYYGENETLKLLSEEYGWAINEMGFTFKVFDNREAIYELSEITTKREFIKNINTVISGRSSLKEAYNSIKNIAKRFNETMGIDMEGQLNLLKFVDAIKDDETKLNSVRRIITEALTTRPAFNPFGELFDRNLFN